jgi:hypothetical protein
MWHAHPLEMLDVWLQADFMTKTTLYTTTTRKHTINNNDTIPVFGQTIEFVQWWRPSSTDP